MKRRNLSIETLGSRELLTSLTGDTAEPVNEDWDADGVDDIGLLVHRETNSTHSYSTGGIYTITVTLTDDDSSSSSEDIDAFFAVTEEKIG